MICGPLAFRSNEWRKHNGRFVLTSPTKTEFEWTEPIAWAKCYNGCPKDSEGHVMIRRQCSCGIYATITPAVVNEYILSKNSVVCLVEALDSNLPEGGNIWLHEHHDYGEPWEAGFTAPGAQIVYLVNTHGGNSKPLREMNGEHRMNPSAIAMLALSEQFHVDIISLQDALALCKMQWEKYGMMWRK